MARGVSADYVARHKNVIKVLAVVDNSAVVTVRVVDDDRSGVALEYAPPFAAERVAEGDAAVTFRACAPDGFRPYTQFNGSFIVDRARCAHLEVSVVERPERIPVALSFGAPC